MQNNVQTKQGVPVTLTAPLVAWFNARGVFKLSDMLDALAAAAEMKEAA